VHQLPIEWCERFVQAVTSRSGSTTATSSRTKFRRLRADCGMARARAEGRAVEVPTLSDMARDALAVLDALAIERAT